MDKKERILKKVGKLLSAYGVTEEEKAKFLADLEDGEADDQEELNESEEVSEGKEEDSMPEETTPSEETPIEEETSSTDEEMPEGEGESDTQIPSESETPNVEETPSEEGEPVAEETETIPSEEQEVVEDGQPTTEQPVAEPEPQVDWQGKYEEVQKALEGVTTRLNALTDALTKAGVFIATPTDNPVGIGNQEPSQEMGGMSNMTDTLSKLNR